MTWNKLWAKQWLLDNTDIPVPKTYLPACSWEGLVEWVNSSDCLPSRKFVIKPVSMSLSKGVRILEKNTEGSFITALGDTQAFKEFSGVMLKEVSGTLGVQWFSEEYIEPIPTNMAELCYDIPSNPLIRIMMMHGDFHFGEVHVPTKLSNGRGTINGGARRLAFNYKGELFQNRPPVPTDVPWRIAIYGTKIDVTGRVILGMEELSYRISKQVCAKMSLRKLFSVDGCYRDTPKGPEFVCVEIEHVPDVTYLAKFRELRRPVTGR